MTDKLAHLIQEFLSERRYSDDGGWAPVEQCEMHQLSDILDALIGEKWGQDSDGDYPVEYELVDRTKYRRDSYVPIRYWEGDQTEEERLRHIRFCMINTSIAQDSLDLAIKLWMSEHT